MMLPWLYIRMGKIKRCETFTINYFHYDPFLHKVSSRNSKLRFFGDPEENHSVLIKKIIKMQYLGKNQPIAGTFLMIFIAQQDLHDPHTFESKSILHLHMFTR